MKKVLRMCVVCREMRDKGDLIRVVKTSDGKIFVDNSQKQDGRGAYICKNGECLEKLNKNKAFNRAFKMPVSEEIYQSLINLKENWWQRIRIKDL